MSTVSLSSQINDFFSREEWRKARRVLERELKHAPDDHWILTRISTTYYEEKNYLKAIEFADKARALAPNCPLVLWDLAGPLHMVGRTSEAIKIYLGLLKRGVRAVADDECGEGIEWARSFLTDCLYKLGVCYADLGNSSRAARYFERYLTRVAKGTDSIYTFGDALRRLVALVPLAKTH